MGYSVASIGARIDQLKEQKKKKKDLEEKKNQRIKDIHVCVCVLMGTVYIL